MRSAPDYIQFYPTLRCNQSCEFCFNRSMPPMPDMSSDDFSVMLEKIIALPVSTLDIIGGEPSLHQDIVGFVRKAVQHGLNVNVSSNGTNIVVLEDLLDAGNNVTIGISINDRQSLDRSAGFIQKNKVVVKSIFQPALDEAIIRDILALRPKQVLCDLSRYPGWPKTFTRVSFSPIRIGCSRTVPPAAGRYGLLFGLHAR